MRVLLDENLDHRLRKNIGQHEVFTVMYEGWAGMKNGELLRAAEDDGIEVFLLAIGRWSTSKISGRHIQTQAVVVLARSTGSISGGAFGWRRYPPGGRHFVRYVYRI